MSMLPPSTLLVLDLATDDFVGLWEIEWRAKSALAGAVAPFEPAAIRADVARLLQDGYVALYRGSKFNGDEAVIDAAMANVLVHEPRVWSPPAPEEEHIRTAATDEGEVLYRRLFDQA